MVSGLMRPWFLVLISMRITEPAPFSGTVLHRFAQISIIRADAAIAHARSVDPKNGTRPPLAHLIPGFYAPVHGALIEPILLGGAPRAIAIANGTLAAAVGLGLRLWIVGLLLWLVGHLLAVWAAKRDPDIVDVTRRHLRFPTWFEA